MTATFVPGAAGARKESERARPSRSARSTPSVRPAPRREPPFDDELELATVGRHDRRLPFEAAALAAGDPDQPLRGRYRIRPAGGAGC